MTSKKQNSWLRRLNRRVTNPLMMRFAGRRVYTVVDHIGRRSQKVYHTPVLGQPSGDCFFIPLPYGEDTDWCLNVLAAGGCRVTWSGRTYSLNHPRIIGQAAGEAVYPPVYRFLLHLSGVKTYLLSDRTMETDRVVDK